MQVELSELEIKHAKVGCQGCVECSALSGRVVRLKHKKDTEKESKFSPSPFLPFELQAFLGKNHKIAPLSNILISFS
jgi:hypothetical protein